MAILLVAAALAGCGGGSDDEGTTAGRATTTATTGRSDATVAKLPPGATSPAATNTAAESTDPAEEADEGAAATEASPESSAQGPSASGELSSGNQADVKAVVDDYVAALNRRDAGRACALLAGGCPGSTGGSIGKRTRGGGPSWRRTAVYEVKVERIGDDRARATATVTHHFSDRKYVSVEDDVVYLERVGGRWLLAQPSATFYRAIGYPEPPLRAFSPPPGW